MKTFSAEREGHKESIESWSRSSSLVASTSKTSNSQSKMAEYLASIFGTEKDK